MSDHAKIFALQYTDTSGPGSALSYSLPYREFLEQFIEQHHIKSILDLGCGDMQVMGNVCLTTANNHADYHGIDVIQERIRRNMDQYGYRCPYFKFTCVDARNYVIDPVDLVLCKDVIQHWSTEEIQGWIVELIRTANYKFALITNCKYGPTLNTNIETGGWRAIDLTAPPFSIGEVIFRWGSKDVVLLRGSL